MTLDDESTTKCQSIIDRLANNFQSVSFPPHITLSGTPNWDVYKLKSAIDETLDGCSSLELETTTIRCSSNPYQKLTHGIRTTDELKSLHHRMDACFQGDFAKKAYPHISYLYSKLDCEYITHEIEPFQKEAPQKVLIKQLELVRCKGTPEAWRTLYKWELNH